MPNDADMNVDVVINFHSMSASGLVFKKANGIERAHCAKKL